MNAAPTFRAALRFWLKLGFISFGGPAGQIAVMHRELVERKKWIEEARFLHALNFCMLLPGPEATQLATYCGWLLHGVRGGLAAGILFVLPGAVALWLLSWLYVAFGAVPQVAWVFHGLKAAVLAIVLSAVWRVGRRALRGPLAWGLAVLAFAGILVFHWLFPWLVVGALLLGFFGSRAAPQFFPPTAEQPVTPSAVARTSWRQTLVTAVSGLLIWSLPVVSAGWWLGWSHTLTRLGWFFSKAAVVTFGGAYAVLPYVGQQATEHFHWISAGQMLDGLAFAETTPGPLILVLEFVGFLAGWGTEMGLPPLLAATLGAGMTLWVTFVPTYGFILVGAPYIERLHGQRALSAALAAVTAVVVGVILHLAVWFGWHVIFTGGNQVDWFVLGLTLVLLGLLQRWKWDVIWIVLIAGAAGLVWGWVG